MIHLRMSSEIKIFIKGREYLLNKDEVEFNGDSKGIPLGP